MTKGLNQLVGDLASILRGAGPGVIINPVMPSSKLGSTGPGDPAAALAELGRRYFPDPEGSGYRNIRKFSGDKPAISGRATSPR